MKLPRSLAPFRNRRFAALWTGAFASNIGTWMETVAVGVLVTSETGQAGWAGIVAAAGFVPMALVGPFGGALADDEILAVIAYLKSTWPDEIRRAQGEANERARRAR